MSYPNIHSRLRTNESFRLKIDKSHHKHATPLTRLSIDMVKDFVVADSLHLIDLGVTRKLLNFWCKGKNYACKLSAHQINILTTQLVQCNVTIPSEVNRSVRGITDLKFWKGAEFRTFLLYVGVVVLKDILEPDVYNNFLYLFCAITIFSSEYYMKHVEIADSLIKDFIGGYILIYGNGSVSSNIHNLVHIKEDVLRYGNLSNISAYKFESHLGKLKNCLRSGNLPLSQLCKRSSEQFGCKLDKSKNKVALPRKFTKYIYEGRNFILRDTQKDKWFLTQKNEIIAFKHVLYVTKKILLVGTSLTNKSNFFEKPFRSSNINIFCCKENYAETKQYNEHDLKCKLLSIKYNNCLVFIPLLHTFVK